MESILTYLKNRRTLYGGLLCCFTVLLINYLDTDQLGFPLWGYLVLLGGLISGYFAFQNRGKAKMQSKS